ncbi:MAG: hypothetical protein EXQ97_01440 [Alphaproteobacteria bacterium]|nr:hypothetical protein [Alphaproteobacteria bacterium]
MAFKPNYRHQRAERNRSKEQKREEKLRKREERKAGLREGEPVDGAVVTTGDATNTDDEADTDTGGPVAADDATTKSG